MEGPILAEFSNLNALNQRPVPASGREREAARAAWQSAPSGSQTERSYDRSRGLDDRERLLRGDLPYTATTSNRPNEHFIDDQPPALHLGVAHVMPKATTTEERERLLRRLEMCAKAREESTKIMSIRFAQRDAVKTEQRRERQVYLEKLTQSRRSRDESWSRKLQRSPFAVDLVAENQRIDEENRVQRQVERRRLKSLARRDQDAHNSIFKSATGEPDELDLLRTEKRLLLENERQLKALRDVERSNARTAQILQERRRLELQKQQAHLQQAMQASRESRDQGPWTAR